MLILLKRLVTFNLKWRTSPVSPRPINHTVECSERKIIEHSVGRQLNKSFKEENEKQNDKYACVTKSSLTNDR